MPTSDADIIADFADCLDEFAFSQCVFIWSGVTIAKAHRSSVSRENDIRPAGSQDTDAYTVRVQSEHVPTPYPTTGAKVTIDGETMRVIKRLDQGENPAVLRMMVTTEYGR